MSIHIGAEQGQIAPTVLMPGDPMRAKYIAETFLEDAFCFNEVRGIADDVVACAVGQEKVFYLSDYYRYWHDITDAEVLHCLKEWRMRRRPEIEIPERKPERF